MKYFDAAAELGMTVPDLLVHPARDGLTDLALQRLVIKHELKKAYNPK